MDAVLEVEFTQGDVYQYVGVSPKVHAELMSASSIGAYFARAVRPKYRFIQVR
jgi:hypothetical protein